MRRTQTGSARTRVVARNIPANKSMDQELRVADGYGALVEYFVREIKALGGQLITGAKVNTVRWEKGGSKSWPGGTGEIEIFRADAAVVTLPLGRVESRRGDF